MPHKSFTANGVIGTARKSVLKQARAQSSTSSGHHSPAAAAAAAAAAPGLSLNVTGLLTPPASTSKIENPLPPANPSKQPRDNIKKTIPMSGEKKIRAGDQVQELKVTSLGPVGPELHSIEAVGTSIAAKGKSVAEVDKVAAEPRTRKVVRKVTRVVKKIVKRKVPKRPLSGAQANAPKPTLANKVDSESNGSFGEDDSDRVANVIDDRFESLSPIVAAIVETDGIENSEISSSVFRGNEEALEVGSEKLEVKVSEEVAKIVPSSQGAVDGETVEELRGIKGRFESLVPVDAANVETDGIEISEICSSVSRGNEEALEVENEKLEDVQGYMEEIVKLDPSAERVVEGEIVEEMRGTSCGSSSQGFAAEEIDGNETVMVEDQSKTENLELVEMKTGDKSEDLSGCSVSKGKKDVDFNPTLGGEMEALERRKRRRTEIFVGGLDKATKEEDIRKLFEQAGEVKQVRLMKGSASVKKKGFAFVQYATAEDAKKALEKFSTVEICGKQCGVRAVEGNDTIFLGNINKRWKREDVVQQLQAAKILNIDQVVVMANPSNSELNRGFAFVEFQTARDAQIALSKLEKHDIFIKQMKIKVCWAQPLIEPNEEELLKVRTVYVENVPSFWDEAEARNFFKRFGEIESISLVKNLPSARRKDIAFVNYLKREAALACIEACAHEQGHDGGSEVKVKASLAKPVNKVKQTKQVGGTNGKEHVKEKRMTSNIVRVHDPIKIEKHISKNLEGSRVDRASSTTDELLLLLRQQARQPQPGSRVAQVRQPQPGLFDSKYHYEPAGSKRPFSALGNHAIYPEPRVFSLPHSETSPLYGSTSHADRIPMHNSQGRRVAPTVELPRRFEMDPQFKTREHTAYFGPSGSGTRTYQRY